MSEKEYLKRVVELFRFGDPTEDQWEEMAKCVLDGSESCYEMTEQIDMDIAPELFDTDLV